MRNTLVAMLLLLTAALAGAADAPMRTPDAVIDLAAAEGSKAVQAEWRYADARIIDTDFRAVGADGQPGASPVRTYDIEPHAGAAEFDDSAWPVITPESLVQRRGNGRLSFGWYRLVLTVPERIGDVRTNGATFVFKTALDDYAEIWVNGELSRHIGQMGGR
jgi:hypothetical protein